MEKNHPSRAEGEPQAASESPGWAGFWSSLLAVGGFWALTLARPFYENIASGPEALTGLGLRRPDVLLLVVVASLLAPAVVALIGVGLGRLFGQLVRSAFIASVIGILAGIFCWQHVEGSAAVIRYLLPLAVTGTFVVLLIRSKFIQNFAVLLGIAMPVVIVGFLASYPIWAAVGPHDGTSDVAEIKKDTPVVVVIFDELPLVTLENSKGRIDGKLFPNIAALAKKSNWYPDMLAAGTSTNVAVPSIVTGDRPTSGMTNEPPPPGLPQYPDNVCSLAGKGGYDVHSYEPITDLCTRSLGLGSRITAAIRRGTGATDEGQEVQLAPNDLAPRFANRLASHFKQPWGTYDSGRQGAITEFIDGMPAEGRSLSLLHIALPHIYWEFMPDGSHYVSNRFGGADSLSSPTSKAQVTHDFQQYMLQMVYTDRQLGRVIKRMKSEGTWDDALFIVTADHGAGFIPSGSRRILEDANSGWVLPVPLFVKFPGQKEGKVVPGGANSIDIAPTIYETLGIEAPSGIEGKSLVGVRKLPSTPEITANGNFGTVQMKRSLVEGLRDKAMKQRNATFADGQLFALSGHAGLLGKRPGRVSGLEPVASIPDQAAELADVDTSSGSIPAYLKAEITTPGIKAGAPIAVALNGKIVATTATWEEGATGRMIAGVNMPTGDFVDGANPVELFEVTGGA